jgi:hypothetical protein
VTTIPGIERRLTSVHGMRVVGRGIAIGHRTFLIESAWENFATVRRRRGVASRGNVHRFGRQTVLVVSFEEMPENDSAVDLWDGSDLPVGGGRFLDTPDLAEGAPHMAVDFLRRAAGPTFVCVSAKGEGFELLPCPVEGRSSEVPRVVGGDELNRPRLGPGLPVLENGRLVGLTVLTKNDDEHTPIHTIADVVRDIATELLEPRDWARIARRIREDPSLHPIEDSPEHYAEVSPEHPLALMTTFAKSRSRALLQFALDQSIRRLETRDPSRSPKPQMRAELVLDKGGRPVGSSGKGLDSPLSKVSSQEYFIRLSLAGPTAPSSRAVFTLEAPWMEKTRTVYEIKGQFPIELRARGDLEVSVKLEDERSRIELRAKLCDLLDEAYLHPSDRDIRAIEDAIDDMRRR